MANQSQNNHGTYFSLCCWSLGKEAFPKYIIIRGTQLEKQSPSGKHLSGFLPKAKLTVFPLLKNTLRASEFLLSIDPKANGHSNNWSSNPPKWDSPKLINSVTLQAYALLTIGGQSGSTARRWREVVLIWQWGKSLREMLFQFVLSFKVVGTHSKTHCSNNLILSLAF